MACKFCNESHLLPNLYARVQRFSAIRGVSVKKKESPNSRSGKWTPLTLTHQIPRFHVIESVGGCDFSQPADFFAKNFGYSAERN